MVRSRLCQRQRDEDVDLQIVVDVTLPPIGDVIQRFGRPLDVDQPQEALRELCVDFATTDVYLRRASILSFRSSMEAAASRAASS